MTDKLTAQRELVSQLRRKAEAGRCYIARSWNLGRDAAHVTDEGRAYLVSLVHRDMRLHVWLYEDAADAVEAAQRDGYRRALRDVTDEYYSLSISAAGSLQSVVERLRDAENQRLKAAVEQAIYEHVAPGQRESLLKAIGLADVPFGPASPSETP